MRSTPSIPIPYSLPRKMANPLCLASIYYLRAAAFVHPFAVLTRSRPFNLGWRELPSKVTSSWLYVDRFV